MKTLFSMTWLGVWLLVPAALAQTNAFPASGNVGIGTPNPGSLLDINGSTPATASSNYSSGTIHLTGSYWNGTSSATDYWQILNLQGTGTNPSSMLFLSNPGAPAGSGVEFYLGPASPFSIFADANSGINLLATALATSSTNYGSPGMLLLGNYWNGSASAQDYWGWKNVLGTGTNPTSTLSFVHNGSLAANVTFPPNANVGIGTTPQYSLDVAGAIHATGLINATTRGVKYPDGNTQIFAWTGVLCGGDYAEAVDPAGDRQIYEPGDVLVISDGDSNDVRKSAEPYSTLVAGIYATKPGVVGRRQSLPKNGDDVPMAMVGIVPTKVTTENGPIHKGDLLVTSSRSGYAMKGTNRKRMLGAVIGKSMGSLDSGEGTIEVLVTLQ